MTPFSPGLTVRVTRKTAEAIGIFGYHLESADGAELPAFEPGSHVDVYLSNGVTRQYSLCGTSTDGKIYQIAVLKELRSRGGSEFMHESIHEGDLLEISLPKNHFQLARGAELHILLAGGVGITPILCMAKYLSSVGEGFELHYSCRSPERAAFRDDILRALDAESVHLHFDDGSEQQRLDIPSIVGRCAAGTHLYVCGPSGFMEAVLGQARKAGWGEDQLHYEFFSRELPANGTSDLPFSIKLASTGKIIEVRVDQTAAEALQQAGVPLETSCEQGVCGTCLTRILEGVPDHRDAYLMQPEKDNNDRFTPCCSRAKSTLLVIDL